MKMQRFVAASMREALAMVREEQGPDAVIISNRRIDDGIELITAVDYDETLIEHALRRPRAAAPAAPAPQAAAPPPPPPAKQGSFLRRVVKAAQVAAPVAAPTPAAAAPAPVATRAGHAKPPAAAAAPIAKPAAAKPAPAAAPAASAPVPVAAVAPAVVAAPAAAPAAPPPAASTIAPAVARVIHSQAAGILDMRREVETMRALLQDQLASLAWNDRLRREPQKAQVLRELSLMGLAPDIARGLAERVPPGSDTKEAARLAAAAVLKHVPSVDDGLLTEGGVFAVVGPTGIGKTTTIAKLAARWAIRHGARDVALVSLDHYRIGARDQLMTFARILGIPMQVATDRRELAAVLARLSDRRLVLIDTGGMSPRDARQTEQFMTLEVQGRAVRSVLALAANGEHAALDRAARSYAVARPESLILTKVDEAASLGPALSVAIRHALPLSWLADGQRVPEDLSAAPPKCVWLVKRARRLATDSRIVGDVDDAYLAGHFGQVVAHG